MRCVDQITSSLLFDVPHTSQSHNVVRFTLCVPCLLQDQVKGHLDKMRRTLPLHSMPMWMMDDGSVPMTTNPSYGQIELSGIHSKPIYANL